MAFPNVVARRAARAQPAWLDTARVLAAFGSLTAAFWAATRFAVGRAYFVLLLGAGLAVFASLMIALGRDVAARWVAFGAQIGFAPASRRPLLDLGTDRPVLHGTIRGHCARLRLVLAGRDAWLQAEVDLLADGERAAMRAARLGATVRDGRLVMRDPLPALDPPHVRAFLDRVAAQADALVQEERPDERTRRSQ